MKQTELLFLLFIIPQVVFSLETSAANTDGCFQQGQCTESYLISGFISSDEFTCLDYCTSNKNCTWFTFSPHIYFCELFSNCLVISTETCPDCLSGESSCLPADPKCWINGECSGILDHFEETDTKEDCLQLCQMTLGCRWFTYHSNPGTCSLYNTCDSVGESCVDCVSGERRCEEDFSTTTSTTTTSTTTTPTTGLTKILVVGGLTADWNTCPDIEIIEMASIGANCTKIENFPRNVSGAIGGLDLKNRPFICGGKNSKECYKYENGIWNQGILMNEGRYLAAQVSVSQGLLITGGTGPAQNSSEIQTNDTWEYFLPSLPINIWFHCMVLINSATKMVIGGYQNGNYTPTETFILENGKDRWIEGPQLLSGRHAHSCGKIRQSIDNPQLSIIVVGGWNAGNINSTEILDFGASEWRRGPDLPYGISCSGLIEEPSGSILLIGGQRNSPDVVSSDIFRLAHAGEGAEWELLPQKLQTARRYHTAFFIPDELADCS